MPLFFAQATPGGAVTAAAYEALTLEMFTLLEGALPVDGCLVVPHGAAVCASHPDMDGHWLGTLREKLGEAIPVIGTLDPHANVSAAMATWTNALVAYKTNPHVDQRAVGKEAARLMLDTLEGSIRPQQALLQLPLAISIEQQESAQDPMKSFLARGRQQADRPGILSWSLCLGFPYADVAEMGTSILVIADGDRNQAREVAQSIAAIALEDKSRFSGERLSISGALGRMAGKPGPVLLLDMGDNVGGGAQGNSTFLLRALEDEGYRFFMCLFDPAAVSRAGTAPGEGYFPLRLQDDTPGAEPLTLRVKRLKVGEGRFTEPEPRHGGQQHYDMGRTAVVETSKGNILMLHSLRIAPFSLRQLECFGIAPRDFDIVVAKGVHAPIAAYGPVCPTILRVDTPGVTRADMTGFRFRNRRIPLYPFEDF